MFERARRRITSVDSMVVTPVPGVAGIGDIEVDGAIESIGEHRFRGDVHVRSVCRHLQTIAGISGTIAGISGINVRSVLRHALAICDSSPSSPPATVPISGIANRSAPILTHSRGVSTRHGSSRLSERQGRAHPGRVRAVRQTAPSNACTQRRSESRNAGWDGAARVRAVAPGELRGQAEIPQDSFHGAGVVDERKQPQSAATTRRLEHVEPKRPLHQISPEIGTGSTG